MKFKFEIGDLVSHSQDYKGIVIGVETCARGATPRWHETTYKVYFFHYGKALFYPGYRLRKLEAKDDNQG